jgi:histidinol dehydrogenase
MSDDDIDTSEYLRSRKREISDEPAQSAQDLEVAVTDETVPIMRDGVAEAVRASGNSALAREYSAAFDTFMATSQRVREKINAGIVDQAACDAMNDAHERFERIDTEVGAWLDKCEKGDTDGLRKME